jgi:hypothetical protein
MRGRVASLGVVVAAIALASAACGSDEPPKAIPPADRPGPGIISVAESITAPASALDAGAVVARVAVANRLARQATIGFEQFGALDDGLTARFAGFSRCARDCSGGAALTDATRAEALAVDESNSIDIAAGESVFVVVELAGEREHIDALERGCPVGLRALFLLDNGQPRHLTGPDGFVFVIRDDATPPAPDCP